MDESCWAATLAWEMPAAYSQKLLCPRGRMSGEFWCSVDINSRVTLDIRNPWWAVTSYPNSQELLYKSACVESWMGEWCFWIACKHADLWPPLRLSPTSLSSVCKEYSSFCAGNSTASSGRNLHVQIKQILKYYFEELQPSSFHELLKIFVSAIQMLPMFD